MTKLTPEQQELLKTWQEFLTDNSWDDGGGMNMMFTDTAIIFIEKLLGAKDAEKADAVKKERERVIERCVDNFVYYRVTDQPIGQRRAIVSPYFLKQILKSKLSQNDQQ